MTPFRVAVLGNSHIAAFAQGWTSLAQSNRDLVMTMFPTPASTVNNLRMWRGRIVSRGASPSRFWAAAGSPSVLDSSDYDAFLCLGFGGSMLANARILRTVTLLGGRRLRGRVQLVSEAVLTAAFVDTLLANPAFLFASRIVGRTEIPAYFVPAPRPSTGFARTPMGAWFEKSVSAHESERVAVCFEAALSEVALRCGMTLLPQPPHTRFGSIHTHDEFKRGGAGVIRGPDNPKPNDAAHMNRDYGIAVLNEHLPRIRAELVAAGPRRTPQRKGQEPPACVQAALGASA